MSDSHSDALVFFGATGDLAYKKIFPSLLAMVKRGTLNVPVVGVARSSWDLDKFRARAYDSIEKHGSVDRTTFDKLCRLLRYVGGDYNDPGTFSAIRRELGSCNRLAYYLAIPPVLFGPVVEQLGKSNCVNGARVIIEKPSGTDLVSARSLNEILLGIFAEKDVFRSTTILASGRCTACSISVLQIPSWSLSGIARMSRVCRSPWPKILGFRDGAPFTIRPALSAMWCRITCFRF